MSTASSLDADLDNNSMTDVQVPASLCWLAPIEVEDLIRVGGSSDGGYVLPEALLREADVLISMGLGHNWQFEKDARVLNPRDSSTRLRPHRFREALQQGIHRGGGRAPHGQSRPGERAAPSPSTARLPRLVRQGSDTLQRADPRSAGQPIGGHCDGVCSRGRRSRVRKDGY